MKQTVQQKKGRIKPAAKSQKAPIKSFCPQNGTRSNHLGLANEKWEQQANNVAGRISRGENNVVRFLTPAPTAGKKVLTSQSETLAQTLREDLEVSFGADLSGVRIHRDSAAHAVTNKVGAKAFTSGRDIYFSRGSFNPDSEQGRAILFHEMAHTLQQTGRPSSDGRMRVTDVLGQGPIQRIDIDPDNPPVETDLDGTDQIQKIAYIVYLRVGSDVAKLRRVNAWLDPLIEQMRAISPTPENVARTLGLLEDAASETTVTGREDYENEILYDFLKIMPYNELAADFLGRHRFLATAFYTQDIVNLLYQDKGNEWMASAMEDTWLANRLWDDAYRQALTRYLRTPTEDVAIENRFGIVEGLGGHTSENLPRTIETRKNTRSRLELNEWATEGARLVVQADTLIRRLIGDIEQGVDINREQYSQLEKRLEASYQMANLELRTPEGSTSIHPTSSRVQTVMREVGQQNVEFYLNLVSREDIRLERYQELGEDLANQQDEARQYWQHSAFQAYVRPLFLGMVTESARLLSLTPHTSHELINTYRPLQTQAQELATYIDRTIIGPTLSRALSEAEQAEPDSNLVNGLYWFSMVGNILYRFLLRIVLANPTDIHNFLDTAINNRYLAMIYQKQLGLLWELQSQVEVFDRLLTGRDIQQSQLAIPNDPEVNASVEFTQFETDFGGRVTGFQPYTAADIVRFMHWDHENRLLGNIQSRITAREDPVVQGNTGVDDLFLIAHAERMTEEQESLRPTRYQFTDTAFIYYPGDDPNIYSRLIEQHHRYQALASQLLEQAEAVSVPGFEQSPAELIRPNVRFQFSGENENTLIIWSIPRLEYLIRLLKGIRILNALVYLHRNQPQLFTAQGLPTEEGSTTREARPAQPSEASSITRETNPAVIARAAQVTDAQIIEMQRLDEWQWYQTLSSLGDGNDILRSYGTQARREMFEDLRIVRREMPYEMRYATTMDRQVLTRSDSTTSISGLLQRYNGRGNTYNLIRRAFDMVEAFQRNIRPGREEPLQMAALMLELASDFHGAIRSESLPSINRRTYRWFVEALDYATVAQGETGQAPLLQEPNQGILLSSERNQTWINAQVALLREIMEAQTSRLIALQEELRVYGFQSPDSGRMESELHGSPILAGALPEVVPGEEEPETDLTGPFILHGLQYEILQVHTDFTIFVHTGQRSDNPDIQRHLLHAPGMVAAGSEVAHARDGIPLAATTPLVTYRITLLTEEEGEAPQSQTIVIHAGDTERVKDFAFLVHQKSNLIGLRNLATAIQYFGEGLMFVASLTPLGWVVDVVMLIQMISEAMDDEGFLAEVRAFAEDPLSILDELEERFTEALTVDRLLELLLFGFAHYNLIAGSGERRRTRRPRVRRPGRRGIRGAHIMESMRNLGRTLAYQLRRVEQNVQQPVGSLQAFVLSRSILRTIFSWVGAHYYEMIGMADTALRNDDILGTLFEGFTASENPSAITDGEERSRIEFLWGNFDERIGALRTQVNGIINSIEGFELPEEVFPTEEAAVILGQAFLDFLTRRPRGRVGLLLRALNEGGRATGANQILFREMSDLLVRERSIDPNVYWRGSIIPRIGDHVELAAHDLAESLQHLLTNTPIIKDVFSGGLIRPAIEVTASGEAERAENVPEASDFLAELESQAAEEQGAEGEVESTGGGGGQPAILPGTLPKLGMPVPASFPGKPLPTLIHQQVANRFGQDFSHVRVNQYSPVTRQLGVKALTTGSQIHLSRGLGRDDDSQSTLNHELTHVIQQAGSRPLGHHYDNRVQSGTMGKGLYYSPRHEQEARRSEKLHHSNQDKLPLSRGEDYAMPAVHDSIVVTLMNRLTSDTDLRTDVATIQERVAHRGRRRGKLPTQALRGKANTWCSAVLTIINNDQATLRKAAFLHDTSTQFVGNRNVFNAVKHHIANNRANIMLAARLIAYETQKEYRTGQRRNGRPDTRTDIDATAFFRLLEGYLLLETGVGVNISSDVAETAGVVSATVNRVRMYHLYLPKLGSSQLGFWSVVSQNSFGPRIPVTTVGAARDTELARWQRRARGILHGQPFLNPFVRTRNYKFKNDFIDTVERSMQGSENIEPSEWPDWQTYLDKDRQSTGRQIGLRIGTYNEAGTGGLQNGPNRQSHHIIQYLMIQYFGQSYTPRSLMPQPFPDSFNFPVRYVSSTGGNRRNVIQSVGDVNVTYFNEGERGGPMPAILLSARAHRRSNLHITAEHEERPDGTVSSNRRQAYAVDQIYRGHLRDEIQNEQLVDLIESPNESDNSTTFNTLMRNTTHQNDIGTAAPTAMKQTYSDIRRHMLRGLQQTLDGEEKDYYTGFVTNNDAFKRNGSLKPEYNPDQLRSPNRRLRDVYNDARDESNELFREKGWE